jgi:hypothetical protein
LGKKNKKKKQTDRQIDRQREEYEAQIPRANNSHSLGK